MTRLPCHGRLIMPYLTRGDTYEGGFPNRSNEHATILCAPISKNTRYNRLSSARTFMSRQQAVIESAAPTEAQSRVWDAFRRWGYLQANLDPLGDLQPVELPELFPSS